MCSVAIAGPSQLGLQQPLMDQLARLLQVGSGNKVIRLLLFVCLCCGCC
jgi:hypothetical protein